jgi:TetR/AcrR family transcriptional regulator
MGIAERREREREQRRNDIVDAAERVFFAKGWTGATMDDVAEEAELSKATLYLYFKNKEDLYAAIVARGSRVLNQLFREAVESAETGLAKTAAIGRAYIRFFHDHTDYFNALQHFESKGLAPREAPPSACEADEIRDETMELVSRAIASGVEDGSMRADLDPVRTALILWAQTTGLLQVLTVAGDEVKTSHGVEPAELLETYFDMTFHALTADPTLDPRNMLENPEGGD